jgi:hypothetical protein
MMCQGSAIGPSRRKTAAAARSSADRTVRQPASSRSGRWPAASGRGACPVAGVRGANLADVAAAASQLEHDTALVQQGATEDWVVAWRGSQQQN